MVASRCSSWNLVQERDLRGKVAAAKSGLTKITCSDTIAAKWHLRHGGRAWAADNLPSPGHLPSSLGTTNGPGRRPRSPLAPPRRRAADRHLRRGRHRSPAPPIGARSPTHGRSGPRSVRRIDASPVGPGRPQRHHARPGGLKLKRGASPSPPRAVLLTTDD